MSYGFSLNEEQGSGMTYKQICGTALLMMIATSCATTDHRTAVDIGSVEKGAIGQLSGQYTEVTVSAMSGDTVIGTIVNKEMDSFDKRQLNYAYERGPAGQPVAWVNPDTGNYYQVISQFTSKDEAGLICRHSEMVAHINSKLKTFNLMACRTVGGGWALQK